MRMSRTSANVACSKVKSLSNSESGERHTTHGTQHAARELTVVVGSIVAEQHKGTRTLLKERGHLVELHRELNEHNDDAQSHHNATNISHWIQVSISVDTSVSQTLECRYCIAGCCSTPLY